MKNKKVIKLWNGPGVENREHLFIGAYSVADACRMLVELYQYMNANQWRHEIDIYFSKGCWGNNMDGITPDRGIWLLQNEYSKEEVLSKIYPIVK